MRRLIGASLVALVMVVMSVGSAAAYGGSQTAASACGGGKLVINVTEKVVNDIDSGDNGNYWAHDTYNRQIQIWQTGAGTFCATVDYQGQFVTIGGESPGIAFATVSDGVKGTFNGGFRAAITGALAATPGWRTKGSVGTVDYQCDALGNCPGYVSFLNQYFAPGWTFTYQWWGWQYQAGSHGTWINSSDGNSGDITG